MAYDEFEALQVRVEGGIARATMNHPPINLLDLTLIVELNRFGRQVAADDSVRVVVLDSADPEFFAAHADVSLIQQLPTDDDSRHDELSAFQRLVDGFRTMPKATIAIIEGIARGGGSELALSCDMRFAALGRAVLAQPEVAIGIVPGGSGTQRLHRLVGRGRALEIVLGCGDIDAKTAERWGYVNRALPDGELTRLRRFAGGAHRVLPARGDRPRQVGDRCRASGSRGWTAHRGSAVSDMPQ